MEACVLGQIIFKKKSQTKWKQTGFFDDVASEQNSIAILAIFVGDNCPFTNNSFWMFIGIGNKIQPNRAW